MYSVLFPSIGLILMLLCSSTVLPAMIQKVLGITEQDFDLQQ